MQSRVLHSLLATSLVAFVVLPAVPADAADAGAPVEAGPGDTKLLDEGAVPLRVLALVGPVVAISVLAILGLTITFGAVRQDFRQRRVVYRPRSL